MKHVVMGIAVLALASTACQPTAGDLAEIKAKQDEILAKLGDLEDRLGGPRPAARPQEDYNRVYQIPVAHAPIKGNPNAPVTIVEYSDFQCPFCAQAQPLLEQLLAKYPDDVRLVFKHFPLSIHPAARPTAVAAFAAQEQGKFWEFHDVLFENGRALDPSKLEEYAAEAGLDVARFKADLEKNRAEYEKRVDEDYQAGTSFDVRGTPTLYVNGRKVRNRSVEGMSAMIDAALAEAKAEGPQRAS